MKINVQDEKTVVRYPTSTQRTSSLGTPACRTMRLFVEGGASGIEWKNVPDNAARACFLRIGLVLIWFVYKRRKSGLILAGLATVVCFALWKMFVP